MPCPDSEEMTRRPSTPPNRRELKSPSSGVVNNSDRSVFEISPELDLTLAATVYDRAGLSETHRGIGYRITLASWLYRAHNAALAPMPRIPGNRSPRETNTGIGKSRLLLAREPSEATEQCRTYLLISSRFSSFIPDGINHVPDQTPNPVFPS
jgi:hypothetical protein